MSKKNQNSSRLPIRQLNYAQRADADRRYAEAKMGQDIRFVYGDKFGQTYWADDQGRVFRVAYYNTSKYPNKFGITPTQREARFYKLERVYAKKAATADEPAQATV